MFGADHSTAAGSGVIVKKDRPVLAWTTGRWLNT